MLLLVFSTWTSAPAEAQAHARTHARTHVYMNMYIEKGCKPDPKNIEAIMKINPPKNLKDVRRYLGLTGFYRKFIPSYARLALPLTNLAKKNTEFV